MNTYFNNKTDENIFNEVKEIIAKEYQFINQDEIQGIFVKELPNADLIFANKSPNSSGNTSHIACTTKNRNFFGKLIVDATINNNNQEKYFYDYNEDNPSNYRLEINIPNEENNGFVKTDCALWINDKEQIAISKKHFDGEKFYKMREKMYKGDILIFFLYGEEKDLDNSEYYLILAKRGDDIYNEIKQKIGDCASAKAKSAINYNPKLFIEKDDDNTSNGDIYCENRIIYGPPGTGKSYKVTEMICEDYEDYKTNSNESNNVFRTAFHPEYTYYDFVGSILPVVEKENNNIVYKFKPGIFTTALKRAIEVENKEKVYLVLEEMSRGNVAAIFGDLFQLLDRDEFGKSEYKIKNELIASEIYGEYGKDKEIYIPSNLEIIGTMNTNDQNVFTMDNAFKRRFEMEYMKLDPVKDKNGEYINNYVFKIKDNDDMDIEVSWIDFYQAFNKYIVEEMGLPEDKQIGQFFIKFIENDKEYTRNYNKLKNKLLQYIWNDISSINDQSKDIIDKKFRSFSQVYQAFEDNKNIFSEDFLSTICPNKGTNE